MTVADIYRVVSDADGSKFYPRHFAESRSKKARNRAHRWAGLYDRLNRGKWVTYVEVSIDNGATWTKDEK